MVKGLSPGSTLMNKNIISAPPTLNIYLSDQTFTKYDIFEAIVKFPPRVTPISIAVHYHEHHNMYYISQLKKNITQNRELPAGNITNVRIISIGGKYPT